SPDNPDAFSILALAEFRLGKVQDAQKHLEEAVGRFPDNLRAARTSALIKISANDFAGAEAVLRATADRDRNSGEPQLALGRFYLVVKRPLDAEIAFRRAAEIDPNSGRALMDLAMVQKDLGHTDQAENTLRRLSRHPDKDYRPLHAIYLYEKGQREEAIKEFEQLAKEDPNDGFATVRLIRAYFNGKRLADAERVIDARLKKNPKDTGVLIERSKLYLATGRIQEAQQILTELLRLEPNSA